MYKMYKRIAHETIAETKYWDNEFQLYTIIEYQLHHIFTSIELMKHYFTRFKKKKFHLPTCSILDVLNAK
jgi:hypothetical protein